MAYITDGEGLNEFRVHDFFVRRRDCDDIEGGVQPVLSRVIQHLIVEQNRTAQNRAWVAGGRGGGQETNCGEYSESTGGW